MKNGNRQYLFICLLNDQSITRKHDAFPQFLKWSSDFKNMKTDSENLYAGDSWATWGSWLNDLSNHVMNKSLMWFPLKNDARVVAINLRLGVYDQQN